MIQPDKDKCIEEVQSRYGAIASQLAAQIKSLPDTERWEAFSDPAEYVRSSRLVFREGEEHPETLPIPEFLKNLQREIFDRYPDARLGTDKKHPRVKDWIVAGGVFGISSQLRVLLEADYPEPSHGGGQVVPGREFHTNETGTPTTQTNTLRRRGVFPK